ncbi:MAG: quinoprotein glucose dehydrogenase [Gammaproteobacteria bacterium]|nr:quinoprotein glucose dehydrogenase [Gammaproteobacteria bacterium]|tara:strand:+ start:117 stop:2162 length:2046 start_codon:yes stop_codon:yes gene_type:complete
MLFEHNGPRFGRARRATTTGPRDRSGSIRLGARAMLGTLLTSAALGLAAPAMGGLHDGTANGEWRYWGGDEASSRYSPLEQINADNFENLEVAWRWKADNYGPDVDYILRATPLYVKGKLYAVAGQRRTVVSIDPATGETLWMWRMKDNPRWQKSTRKNYGKGVAYAHVDGRDVIYVITPGYYMAALDADSGQPIPGFGINGVVDLHLGLGDYPVHPDRGIGEAGDITSSSPPIVVNGVIVVGNSHDRGYYPDAKENVPGHIRGYDAKTGRMLWRFNVVPKPGEFGYDTWEDGSAEYTGNVSAWAPLSADSERGLVYVVTDTPTNDYYGGDRLGDNLFGTSILALDVKTGERRWHFQMVHHDVWNLDNPNAPKLLDVKMGRRTVPVVVETTKQGWAYVFNRETGEPIWPIEEREVPQSDVPGERLAPTQPFVTKPPPFELQGATEDDLIDFTPELREQALEIARNYRMGPIFNPPSLLDAEDGTRGAFVQPGANGGANIPGGSSVDPETGMLYVATERGHSVIALVPGADSGSNAGYVSTGPGGIRGPQGLELFKPPYGSVVALDLKKGDKAWHIPNGDTPDSVKNHPALQGVDLPRTGKRSHANVLTTKSLLYYAEGRRGAPILHAVDKASGEELGEFELPAPGNTAPMTYLHDGVQYIIVSVGGPGSAGEFVALRLEEE